MSFEFNIFIYFICYVRFESQSFDGITIRLRVEVDNGLLPGAVESFNESGLSSIDRSDDPSYGIPYNSGNHGIRLSP